MLKIKSDFWRGVLRGFIIANIIMITTLITVFIIKIL